MATFGFSGTYEERMAQRRRRERAGRLLVWVLGGMAAILMTVGLVRVALGACS